MNLLLQIAVCAPYPPKSNSTLPFCIQNSTIPDSPPIFCFPLTNRSKLYKSVRTKKQHPVVNFAGPVAPLVPDVFSRVGFSSDHGNDTQFFTLNYGSPRPFDFYDSLQPGQMCNQIPGSMYFTRKDALSRYIQAMQSANPQLDFAIIPRSYNLPQDLELLQSLNNQSNSNDMNNNQQINNSQSMSNNANNQQITKDNQQTTNNQQTNNQQTNKVNNWFIYKPVLSARGENLKLIHKTELEKITGETAATVQEYTEDVLLIHKRKFDLRVYFLITSVDPYVVYIYNEGIARFASEDYQNVTFKNRNDLRMHLTNFAVNKGHKSKIQLKQSMTSVLSYIDKHPELIAEGEDSVKHELQEKEHIKDRIFQNIQNALTKALIATYTPMLHKAKECDNIYKFPRRFFGYYGADIILDKKGNAKILEINASPSLNTDSDEDEQIKTEFLEEILNIIALNANIDDQGNVIIPKRGHENPKIYQFNHSYEENKAIDIHNLTAYEKRVYQQITDEESRLNKFQRILPDAGWFEDMSNLNGLVRSLISLNKEIKDVN
ncbi:Tubulin_tyrosine ligase [Hexamita inflata]|uniref:Tubulin--tyrosine ligase-like protein 5 n=1 Tax=Hexamita inflata TaxID=28002 RepID=A0AA86RDB1_9EUKA|nr:Tubulin tyrosine ligase [Hexamita inflata]